jgi:hypothetical protein
MLRGVLKSDAVMDDCLMTLAWAEHKGAAATDIFLTPVDLSKVALNDCHVGGMGLCRWRQLNCNGRCQNGGQRTHTGF